MSVTPVSGIVPFSQYEPQQQNGMEQDLKDLQNALNSGDLGAAQQATAGLQGVVENLLPVNGVRASASDNPQEAIRVDLKALQSALDSGDIAEAQQSMARIVQDNQEIAKAQKEQQDDPDRQAWSALPNVAGISPEGLDGTADSQKETGILLDVTG